MLDSGFHVELNGVKYRLAEDAEGDHYVKRREPLRLQTGAVVQGESGKFQIRPDILEWSMSDWAGGMGQTRFINEEANRYYRAWNVDAVSEPGVLKLARDWSEMGFYADGTTLDQPGESSLMLTRGDDADSIYGVDRDTGRIHYYSGSGTDFDSGPDLFGGTLALAVIQSGPQGFHFIQDGTSNARVIRYTGSGTGTAWTGAVLPTDADAWGMASLVDYFYVCHKLGITEIPNTGTATVSVNDIVEWASINTYTPDGLQAIVAADNKLYAAFNTRRGDSVIYEVVPTTAAGAGYGYPILTLRNTVVTLLLHHQGILYVFAATGDPDMTADIFGRRRVYYVNGSEFGVLAIFDDVLSTSAEILWGGGPEATHDREYIYFTAGGGPGDTSYELTLYCIDTVTGGVHPLGTYSYTTSVFDGASSADKWTTGSVLYHGGKVFFTNSSSETTVSAGMRTLFVDLDGDYVDTTAVTAFLETPRHDFGLTDDKVLMSISLSCEALPSGASIEVQYQINQSGSWVSAGTYSTTGGTGTTLSISTGGSPVAFRDLQLRIYPKNGGTTTITPKITRVTTRATVAKGLNTWSLALNLGDEAYALARSLSGAQQIDNLLTAADNENVVTFKDGYPYRHAGQFNEHNVIVDDVQIIQTRPGEGIAYVTLREVV